MSKIYYKIFLQILAATALSFAQPHPVFHHLNTSDGLSNNHVRCIVQDSRGFMWFGTDAGLNRYDGKEFLIFKNIPGDSSSVCGNEIRDLLEDKNGILWVATGDGGLCSYNYRSGKFRQFHNSFYGNGNEIVKSINAIHENQNNFWVGTDKAGLFLFDKTKGTFQLQSQTQTGFNRQEKNKAYSYFDIISHPGGDTYFGTLVYSLQIFRNREFISPVSSTSNPYPAQSVNCIFIDSKNRVWLGAWDNALHEFDKETNSIKTILVNKNKPFSFSEDEIISINEDQNGWLWLGSRRESGLFLFDPQTGRVVNYKKKSGDAGSLSSNVIRAIYRDHQDRMWLCTDAGIDVYDPLLNQFETVYLKTIIDDATDDEIVFDFLEDSAAFYIGTNNGLLVRKTSDERFSRKRILYQNENMQVTKLFKDKRNRIFLGTNKTALLLNPVDFSTKTMNCFFMREYDQFDFFNIDASRIVDIAESNWNGYDVLWFVPYGHGVALFDAENLSGFISTLNIPENPENLVRSVFIDSKNYPRLLCASKGIAYDIQCPFPDSLKIFFENKNFTSKRKINRKFSFLKSKYMVHDPSIASSINSNNVYDMIENGDGTFWITSQGGGLQLYGPRNTKNIF